MMNYDLVWKLKSIKARHQKEEAHYQLDQGCFNSNFKVVEDEKDPPYCTTKIKKAHREKFRTTE